MADSSAKPQAENSSTNLAAEPALTVISPTERARLQQLFDHAQRNAEKNDHDYASDLFIRCVVGDPGSLPYLQSFLANLQKKYNNNKKGSKMAGMKTSAPRKAMKSAVGKKEWKEVIKAGCQVLTYSPWDSSTLVTMANACYQLGHEETQLFCLRWALNAKPKDLDVNRKAAEALARMGQFDQAIACWHRVEEAKPGDEEASKAISKLTVEKTIQHGGYDRELITGEKSASRAKSPSKSSPALAKQPTAPTEEAPEEELPPQERLQQAIKQEPTQIKNYLELAELYLGEHDFAQADTTLQQAMAAAGGGDLEIRERLEDVQIRESRHQVAVAEKRAKEEGTEESQALVQRLRAQLLQTELEVYAARSERNPQSLNLKYELGVRLKKAGKFKDAIAALQAAREDSQRRSQVHLELGECFQKIEQYKLALQNYESALEAAGTSQGDTKKLALYRAGVLATGLRDLDRAERHLTELAGIDFGYRDVGERLDKVTRLRQNQ